MPIAMAHHVFFEDGDFGNSETSTFVFSMLDAFPKVSLLDVVRVFGQFPGDQDGAVNELLRLSEAASVAPRADGARDLVRAVTDPVQTRLESFRRSFPDADPKYLLQKARELHDADEARIQEWLRWMRKDRSYPTLSEYLKRKEVADVLQTYADMDAQRFLSMFADPASYFSRLDRPAAVSKQYKACTLGVLKAVFPEVAENVVCQHVERNGHLLVPSFRSLKASVFEAGFFSRLLRAILGPKVEQKPLKLPSYDDVFPANEPVDLAFIQEFTYLRLEDEIAAAKLVNESTRKSLETRAKAEGAIFECPICREDEVLLEDTRDCTGGGNHMFCRECVSRHAEVCALEGRPKVSCLEHGCPGFFSLAQVSGLLTPALFARLLREVQLSELREAKVEGLEECPFCSFPVAIEDPGMGLTVFKCLNPLCMIDTCRKCKRPDHGTVPCHKVEDDDQVKARVLLEEKLTSALVRNCPRCKKEVVKDEGCSHMTCPCGCHFCYVCRKEIVGPIAAHFVGNGRCPQFRDSSEIHKSDLTKAAREGRRELAKKFSHVKLIHDPTAGI